MRSPPRPQPPRSLLLRALLLGPLLPGLALAAPTADRPTLTDRARLVDTDTLEVEGGVRWTDGALSSPVLIKYTARGKVEPRLGFDSSGFRAQVTGLNVGAKVALVETERDDVRITAHFQSALPLGSSDRWTGFAHALLDLPLGQQLLLSFNTGLDFAGGPGIQLYGVPLRSTIHAPITRSFGVFGEGSTTIVGGRFADWVVDGGLRWMLTSIVQLDASVGYLINADAGWVGLGATANLGHPGG